jgi:hypothetical protein
MILTVPSRHVHMTAKNLLSIEPMLRNRSSSSRGVGTVGRAAIKQRKCDTKKIDPALGQHPFALSFVPAKFHMT